MKLKMTQSGGAVICDYGTREMKMSVDLLSSNILEQSRFLLNQSSLPCPWYVVLVPQMVHLSKAFGIAG